MTLDIRFTKITAELTEDLEIQTGLILTGAQRRELNMKQHVTLKEAEIKPYLADIKEYLRNTESSERVWECYNVLSNNTYIIAIHLVSPFFRFDTADLNG